MKALLLQIISKWKIFFNENEYSWISYLTLYTADFLRMGYVSISRTTLASFFIKTAISFLGNKYFSKSVINCTHSCLSKIRKTLLNNLLWNWDLRQTGRKFFLEPTGGRDMDHPFSKTLMKMKLFYILVFMCIRIFNLKIKINLCFQYEIIHS